MAESGGMGFLGPLGAGLQVFGAGMNIIQGINAKKDQRDAERAAAEALAEAKRKIEVNRMEGVQIPLESYGLATQTLMAAQQQGLQDLRESGQRALQGGLPGLQLATQAGAETQRQAMAKDVYSRDLMIAQEQANIDKALASLSLQEAAGAQAAAAQREQMAAQGITKGIQGLAGAGQTLYNQSALYGSGRQAELGAAKALQNATRNTENPLYQDMNARQAMRAMLRSGNYTDENISNLNTFGTTYGAENNNPFAAFQFNPNDYGL